MFRALALITLLVVAACSREPATQASSAASSATKPATAAAPGATSSSAIPAAAVQGAIGGAQQPAAPQLKPVPAQLPAVIARVNGESIGRGELERAIQAVEARAGGPVPADQRDRIYRGVLDQLVSVRLLAQETKARKVAIPDADVESRLNEIKKQFPSEDAFKQMLASRKLTLEQVKSDARQDLAIAKLLQDEVGSKSAVKPEQVADFYAKNPDQFKQGERVRASHILIAVPQNGDAAAKAQARTKAEEVLKSVKAGKDFAALAKEFSQDPGSAEKGGDLGYFQQGQMVGPFNDAAFSLPAGATSELVETQFGYHIIRVADKQPARTMPLDEIRPQLEQYLQQLNRQQQTDAFVNALKSKGKVEILI